MRGQKAAFTLAEVLITLGVIGVVAAITLPSFIQNHQTKVRNEQNRMVQYKLTKATDQMKSLGLIGNYTTTKDFVNELKKHFKIAQICENDNLEQCWPTKVISTDGKEINIDGIKNGKNMNPTGWTKETLGIITADGTPMIITYKDDCPALEAEKTYTWQTEDNKPVTNATTGCIAAIYDLNGKARPNRSGEDVRLLNTATLGNGVLQCKNDEKSGLCMMSSNLSFLPLEYGTEEYDKFLSDNGIQPCPTEMSHYCKPDRWAGAMKACKEAGGRLPSMAELAIVANIMYHTNLTAYEQISNQTLYEDPFNIGNQAEVWSNELYDGDPGYPGTNAKKRYFSYQQTYWDNPARNSTWPIARCVKN